MLYHSFPSKIRLAQLKRCPSVFLLVIQSWLSKIRNKIESERGVTCILLLIFLYVYMFLFPVYYLSFDVDVVYLTQWKVVNVYVEWLLFSCKSSTFAFLRFSHLFRIFWNLFYKSYMIISRFMKCIFRYDQFCQYFLKNVSFIINLSHQQERFYIN